MELPEIKLSDYSYHLPEDRIAQYPLEKRDESKLLVYSGGKIKHDRFNQLNQHLPSGAMLVFNDTKVIPARMLFQKPTGAAIEIFLLNPVTPFTDINLAMQTTGACSWTCMIGNSKRWKKGQALEMSLTLNNKKVTVKATRLDELVTFQWNDPELRFVDLIRTAGQVPLPPYMKRDAVNQDKQRYQTVYSKVDGAVAAPTAGLHFTDNLLKELRSAGIKTEYLTLHVGAGTFQPIKTAQIVDHPMHGEQINLTLSNIDQLLATESIVAVGTTSLRTLESLHWFGVRLLNGLGDSFAIPKLAPYEKYAISPDFRESLKAISSWMRSNNLTELSGYTEIFIFPPYKIRTCSGLITNFHLPSSTLILLVAAFIGEDWKKVYQQAIEEDYRFLSYGDSSLLLPG